MGKHGGLQRAGEVRKKTPKVAKMEKTFKPVVGRAKMRRKFNKRFFFMKQTGQRKFNLQAS
jgi:ribosomal protein S30